MIVFGVALAAAIAWVAVQLGGVPWLQANGIGSLTVAMLVIAALTLSLRFLTE